MIFDIHENVVFETHFNFNFGFNNPIFFINDFEFGY